MPTVHGFATLEDIRRVAQATRRSEKALRNRVGNNRGDDPPSELWFPFKNDTGETVTRSAVLRITGLTMTNDDDVIINVAKPSTTFSRLHTVNSPEPVPSGQYGVCFLGSLPVEVAYDTGTPAIGETWGPKPSQFTASKNYPGFTVVGIVDSTLKLMLAVPEPILTLLVKADAKIANDSTGTCSVYIDKSTDSTVNITVRVGEYAPDLFADEFATVFFHNGQWYYDVDCKFVDGTLAGTLSQGGTATMNVDPGSDTITVKDRFLETSASMASSDVLGATWNKLRKEWTVTVRKCP